MKFSVIIPAYNSAKTIGRALESVFNQTIKDFEVIVVCKPSSDGTEDIVSKYDVKLIIEDCNISRARNIGIDNAQGEYICFLDSDDVWNQFYLSIAEDHLPTDFMFTAQTRVFPNGKSVTNKCYIYGGAGYFDYFKKVGNTSSTTSALIVKKSEVRFDETMEICEDIEFLIQHFNGKFTYIDTPLCTYYVPKLGKYSHLTHPVYIKSLDSVEDEYFKDVISRIEISNNLLNGFKKEGLLRTKDLINHRALIRLACRLPTWLFKFLFVKIYSRAKK